MAAPYPTTLVLLPAAARSAHRSSSCARLNPGNSRVLPSSARGRRRSIVCARSNHGFAQLTRFALRNVVAHFRTLRSESIGSQGGIRQTFSRESSSATTGPTSMPSTAATRRLMHPAQAGRRPPLPNARPTVPGHSRATTLQPRSCISPRPEEQEDPREERRHLRRLNGQAQTGNTAPKVLL